MFLITLIIIAIFVMVEIFNYVDIRSLIGTLVIALFVSLLAGGFFEATVFYNTIDYEVIDKQKYEVVELNGQYWIEGNDSYTTVYVNENDNISTIVIDNIRPDKDIEIPMLVKEKFRIKNDFIRFICAFDYKIEYNLLIPAGVR